MLDLYQRNERLEVRKRTRLSSDLSELATSNRKGFDARCPISYGGIGTSIGNLSYAWNANKNKTSAGFGGTMSGYGFTSAGTSYDDEDRLTGYATCSMSVPPMVNNPTHKLLTADGKSLATDPKGISTVLSSSLTPQASRLLPVARTGTGGSVVYVQHDQQTIADYPVGGVASTPTNRYVYASYIDEPVVRKAAGTSGTIHYYHRNQQYSITAMTTSTGAVAERYAYTAYGQPTILNASGTVLTSSAVGNRYKYTGREWDETLGLHHFRARWICPLAGRFLGRDPLGYFDSISLFEYTKSNPNRGVDPMGTDSIDPGHSRCYACCCCPVDIDITHGMDGQKCGVTWNKDGWVKYSIKMKFTKIPNVEQVKPGENTCSLEFWEIPFETIPGSTQSGGLLPHSYTAGIWNDAVKIHPEYGFFDPFENFMHPPHYVDPKTGIRMNDCETKGKPNYVTLEMTDRPAVNGARGAAFLYFYSVMRITGAKHPNCKCGPPRHKIFMGYMNYNGWQTGTSNNSNPPPVNPSLPFVQ